MANYRLRTALACKVVGLDRVKFNDAVASGAYTCAPFTMKGSARIFDEESLIPLYFFARLTEFGLPPSRAGRLACDAASVLRDPASAQTDRVILLRSEGPGTEHFIASKSGLPGGELTIYDPEHEKPGRNPKFPEGMCFRGIGRIVLTVEFYIEHVRKIIADRIAYEATILGEEEEE